MAFTWFNQNNTNEDDSTLNKILKGAYAAALLGNAAMDPEGQTRYVLPALASQQQNAEVASLRKRQLDLEERRVKVDEDKLAYATSPAGQKGQMTDYDKKRQQDQYVMRTMMGDPRFRGFFESNNIKGLQTIAIEHGISPGDIEHLTGGVKISQHTFRDSLGDFHIVGTDQNGNVANHTLLPFGDINAWEQKLTALSAARKQAQLLANGSPAQQHQAAQLENELQMTAVGLIGEQAAKAGKLTGSDPEKLNKDMLDYYAKGFSQLDEMRRTQIQDAKNAAEKGANYDIYKQNNEFRIKRFLELHEVGWRKMFPGQGSSPLWVMENGPPLGTMGPDDVIKPQTKEEQQQDYSSKANAAVDQMGQVGTTSPPPTSGPPSTVGTMSPPKPLVNLMKERGHEPSNLVWDYRTKRWLLRDTRPGAKVEFYNIQGY